MYHYGPQSQRNLSTCHPDLQRLFNHVIKVTNCTIIQGHRNKKAQNEAYSNGYSKTPWPDSYHNTVPSEGVDVMPYYPERPHIRWDVSDARVAGDLREFVGIVKGIASQLGIDVEWGGNFRTFFDGPHWQLKRAK